MRTSRFRVAALLGCELLSLPLAGVKRWGWFTYSDSSIPLGTGLVGGSAAIEDLFLQWGGVTYTENERSNPGACLFSLGLASDFVKRRLRERRWLGCFGALGYL